MLKIAISGHLGFVGSATVKLLEKEGHEVIGYDLMEGKDIRDYAQLEQFVMEHKPDRFLHLAAIARFAEADRDPKLAYETNVYGTANVAAVCKKHKIPLVYSSTGSVYMPIKNTPPIKEDWPVQGNSVYGCSKAIGEKYVQECNPYIILRYAHLYGAEKKMHGLIGGYWDRIKRGLAPRLYGGKQSNDFTYIPDVAMANYKALIAPWNSWNQAYNVGTGEELTAEEAGNIVCELTGYKGAVEKLEGREVDPERFAFDCTKAEQMIDFKAKYKFREGLKEMFDTLENKNIKDESIVNQG